MNKTQFIKSLVILIMLAFVVLQQIVHSQNTLSMPANPIYYLNPKWSPDGKRIAFASNFEGNLSIYIISSTGSDMKRITDTVFESGLPNWSPDGKSLVYHKILEGGLLKLFTYSFDSHTEKQVTQSETIDYAASWSSENKLCFNSRQNLLDLNHTVYTLDLADNTLTKITDNQFDYSAPGWSPTAKNIVCIRSPLMTKSFTESTQEELNKIRNSSEIVILDKNGSTIHRLTNDTFPNRYPSFSKSGKNIYYISQENLSSKIIQYELKLGTKKKLFTSLETINNFNVSANEKYITYSSKRDGNYGIYVWDIFKKKERLIVGK